MDKKSHLNPPAIKLQSGSAITQLQKDNVLLNQLDKAIKIFTDDLTIVSKSFQSRKQLMNDFKLLSQAMRQVNEADIVDFDDLQEAVEFEVLEGERILTSKQTAKNKQTYHSDQARNYTDKIRNVSGLENLLVTYYYSMVMYHKQLADMYEESYKIWLGKEEKYDQIEHITSGLFNASESLRTTIQQGINDISGSIHDGVYQPDLGALWRTNLQDETDQLREAMRKKAKELAKRAAVYDEDGNLVDYDWELLGRYNYETIMLILGETEEGPVLEEIRKSVESGDQDLLLEKLKDHRIKEAIRAVNQEERFSFETWENADFEERKAILQDYKDAIEGIYGISTKNEINYYPKEPDENGTSYGYYNHFFKEVSINEWLLNPANESETWNAEFLYNEQFDTIRHELRHAYQHSAVDKPEDFIVSDKTTQSWKKNFDNYIQFEDDPDAYGKQPVEKDAWDFGRVK